MGILDDQLTENKLLLAAVNRKILAITTGAQEHELNDTQHDQKVKNADLATLTKLKSQLLHDIAIATGEIPNGVYWY